MLEIVRTNTHTTFLQRFPQWTMLHTKAQREWEHFTACIDQIYGAIEWPHDDQGGKEMDGCVSEVKKTGLMAPVLFKMWHLRSNAKQVLRNYPLHLLLRIVKAWRKQAIKES